MRFDWDAHNRKKVGAHGERRKIAVGHTEAGRVLVLVYTMRRGKVRAVTAYESRKAREQWQRK